MRFDDRVCRGGQRDHGGIDARATRYSAEQIVAKLREAEKLQAEGLTIPQACKRLGISDQTFYRSRIEYGALKEDEAQRLRAREQENARLKCRHHLERRRSLHRKRTADDDEQRDQGEHSGRVLRLLSGRHA